MQKKVLLSSILVIALCLSVIAGSTSALFTDKAQTSIAITSANVEVTADMVLGQLYSAKALSAGKTTENKYLIDENGKHYEHVAQKDKFLNGGTAAVNEGKITVTNITPGDKFNAKIDIKNIGNVDAVYRFKISSSDKLAKAMVVKLLDANGKLIHTISTPDEFVELFCSKWALDLLAAEHGTAAVYLSFELPVGTGNEYQSEDGAPVSLTYDITVEAVQGNANTNGYTEDNFPGYTGSED